MSLKYVQKFKIKDEYNNTPQCSHYLYLKLFVFWNLSVSNNHIHPFINFPKEILPLECMFLIWEPYGTGLRDDYDLKGDQTRNMRCSSKISVWKIDKWMNMVVINRKIPKYKKKKL